MVRAATPATPPAASCEYACQDRLDDWTPSDQHSRTRLQRQNSGNVARLAKCHQVLLLHGAHGCGEALSTNRSRQRVNTLECMPKQPHLGCCVHPWPCCWVHGRNCPLNAVLERKRESGAGHMPVLIHKCIQRSRKGAYATAQSTVLPCFLPCLHACSKDHAYSDRVKLCIQKPVFSTSCMKAWIDQPYCSGKIPERWFWCAVRKSPEHVRDATPPK
jgi:hypothetical protein